MCNTLYPSGRGGISGSMNCTSTITPKDKAPVDVYNILWKENNEYITE